MEKPQIMEMLSQKDGSVELVTVAESFGDEKVDVWYRKSASPTEYIDRELAGWGFYGDLNQRTYVEEGVVCDQDVAIPLRDGTVIYVDVYRPEGATKVPALVAWGF